MRERAESDGGEAITVGGSLMHSAEPDFSGYVTKADLKCDDGRIIKPDAFKHQDKTSVPLVWQHNHDEPENVLGHVALENREDGVYGYAYLNDSDNAKHAKRLVEHDDIKFFSIFANGLTEKAKNVLHGMIREVSLVLAGANPGALIDNIALQHGNGDMVTLEDEAVIYTGVELEHATQSGNEDEEDNDGPTIQEVYDGMDENEKEVVHYMVGKAIEEHIQQNAGGAQHTGDGSGKGNEQEGTVRMTRNVFEEQNGGKGGEEGHVLTHDAMKGIVADAIELGSLKKSFEQYAVKHGIENLEVLFPDAKAVTTTPEFDARRVEWVTGVINGVRKSPFSRIKSLTADITHEDARARGYIKGNMKKQEYFRLSKRVTTPSTIYKKQQLDRDDIIDITDFDVVAWMKGEMRLMLDEELARAILISDGRAIDDEDKVKDPEGAAEGAGIRSILKDHELYAARVRVEYDLDTNAGQGAVIDKILENMRVYKGSGSPTFYTTLPLLTWLLLSRDGMGRRMFRTTSELAAELNVSNIVPVEVMEGEDELAGIIVNLKDYTLGADRGGDVNFFDDFDIDYNQYKYLFETRLSGALTKIRSAIVVERRPVAEAEVAPAAPLFDEGTGEITIVDTPNVVYTRADTNAVVNAAGSPYVVDPGDDLTINADAAAGFYFETDQNDSWTFERPAA